MIFSSISHCKKNTRAKSTPRLKLALEMDNEIKAETPLPGDLFRHR
ncbi:hypothetical protein ACG1BZ_19875 [Microbulbifer sp. CNSA002]